MKSSVNTHRLTTCALLSAILCIFSVIAIPIGTIPLTLGLFGVIVVGCLSDAKLSFTSVLIYILLGITGLPVFSGMRAGVTVVTGPTGGFIISYILVAPAAGFFFNHANKSSAHRYILYITGALFCLLVCYTIAVIHFMFVMKCNLTQAIFECVLPFIIFDLLKTLSAFYISQSIITRIKQKG